MQTPLTQQELIIYNSINKEDPNIKNVLKTNNISAQDLSNILIKQKNALLLKGISSSMTKSKIITFLQNLMKPSNGYGPSVGDLIRFFVISGPLTLSIPILTTGMAVQQFMAPSPTKTVVSSGLIGASSILSTPAILFGLTAAAGEIEKLLRNIIYYPKLKDINELQDIENTLDILNWYYPKLVTQQAIYQ